MKNYWLDRIKEREQKNQKQREGQATYHRQFWYIIKQYFNRKRGK